MTGTPDTELLAEFARANSEPAFAALVERHIGLVHSVALRHVANPQHAQDITQAVFIILARKASSLNRKVILPGWLYHTARLTAANFQRAELRRVRREQEAYMQSPLNETGSPAPWQEMSPLLDEAMARLGASDRDALVLRYFQNKSLSEVGTAMGLEERTAQKRVLRAIEKLRKFFLKRGVTLSATAITGAVSAHSVQAAPAALAKSVTAIAFTKGAAASTSTLTLIKGALKLMAWSHAKTAIIATGVLLAAGTTTIAVKTIVASQPQPWQKAVNLSVLNRVEPQVKILPSLPSHSWLGEGENHGMMLGLGVNFQDIVAYAYVVHQAQINYPPMVPQGKYDFISSVPRNQHEALQQELQRKFGLNILHEQVDMDYLVLRVKSPSAVGLKRSSLPYSGSETEDTYSGHNQSLWSLVDYLAYNLKTVVIDQTGLSGNFDIDFTWDKTPAGLKQALLEQTGLELVPANGPVPMLTVEDAHHPLAGVGVALTVPPGPNKELKIMNIIPNSPAAQAGIATGSIIQAIDGTSVADKPLGECVNLIRGPADTKVRLDLVDPNGNQTSVVLTRQKLKL